MKTKTQTREHHFVCHSFQLNVEDRYCFAYNFMFCEKHQEYEFDQSQAYWTEMCEEIYQRWQYKIVFHPPKGN